MKKRISWLLGTLVLGILLLVPFGKVEAAETPSLDFRYEMTGEIGPGDDKKEVRLPVELLYESRYMHVEINALDEVFTYDFSVVSEAGEIIYSREREEIHSNGRNTVYIDNNLLAGKYEIIVAWSQYNEEDAQGGEVKICAWGGYLIRPESVTISTESVCIMQGRTYQLKASYAPSYANIDTNITWKTSNSQVAAVNSSGVVTARKAGTVTIRAIAGNVSASCQVKVEEGQGVYLPFKEFSGNKKNWKKNEVTFNLPVKSAVSFGFLANENSKPSGKATISLKQNGSEIWKVTHNFRGRSGHVLVPYVLEPGNYTLVIKANSSKFQYEGYVLCETTEYYKAKSIKLKNKKKTMSVGQQLYLDGSVTPIYTTTSVKWTSSNKKVAVVDQTGLITAKKMGKTVITASVDGKKAKCTIYVTKQNVQSWTGKAKDLSKQVKYVPGYKKGKWQSSNSSVASVNSKGKVTFRKNGKAKITLTAKGKKYVFTVYSYDKEKLKNSVLKKVKGYEKQFLPITIEKKTYDNKNFTFTVKFSQHRFFYGTTIYTAIGYYENGKVKIVDNYDW